MRTAFADEITKLGAEDSRVVLLSGDIGNRMFDDFKDKNSNRFYNCGIAEANMMSMASGMALSGLRPVTYTITPFTTTRCLEQIRVGVCYHNAPVIIVGTGSGLSYSSLGPTHHSLEDIAILRALPGIVVFAPGDKAELRSGLRAALKQNKPVYIRLGKKNEPQVYSDEFNHSLRLGKATTVIEGNDICFIGTGNILPEVMQAASTLKATGISVQVESFHTIKPLDIEKLSKLFSRFDNVVVVEEHSCIGGLNSAIAEWIISQRVMPRARLLSIATDDRFLHEIGDHAFARRYFGIDAKSIELRAIEALSEQT
ncbi:transketolase family protein [Thalassospira alkalitolerans]|uniref:Transketolase n=1 Tax=Thalassospira alkalitolerans TaxID=1293890 RepID=A0A1Y2LHQ2_9PROT|nr:transketolase C-terminal domain-containing protein [Thalassospira alkalitolerans]OSQ50083.1 transketolase [Thalassospira alkalitolerans]